MTDSGRPSVLYSFPHPLGSPGIGTTAYEQVTALHRGGLDVRVACTSLARPLPAGVPVVQRTMTVRGRRIPHRTIGVARALAHHDHAVARRLARAPLPDVVHVWPSACLRTMAVAERLGVPIAREVPNTHTRHAFEVVARELLRLDLPATAGAAHSFDHRRLAREEKEYQAASGLLVPSHAVAQTFLDRGHPPEQLHRTQYGFSPESFPVPAAGAVRGEDAPLRLLFMGRCEPRKGLHHALRAWQQADVARQGGVFEICGEFVPEYRASIGDLLEQPGVVVRGPVSRPSAAMLDSHALVLPSVEEGSALVTYEAQASGCALLVSTAAGAVCQDGVQGLLHTPGDVDTLARHITLLATRPPLRARLRRSALDHREQLTWDVAAERLVDAYRVLAGRRSAAL